MSVVKHFYAFAADVCVSVSPFLPLNILNEWMYFNETDYFYSLSGPNHTDDIEKVTGSKVKVGHRNLVNAIPPESLERFKPKLI